MTTTEDSAAASTAEQVRRLFNPRSIVLIGATDKSRWSWSTWGNLVTHQFVVYDEPNPDPMLKNHTFSIGGKADSDSRAQTLRWLHDHL